MALFSRALGQGLSEAEAEAMGRKYGTNLIAEHPPGAAARLAKDVPGVPVTPVA